MRYMYGLLFFGLVLFAPGAERTLADVGGASPGTVPAKYGNLTPEEKAAAKVSSAVVDFCNKNIVKYRAAFAVLQTPVVVPEPPAMSPDCIQCGHEGKTENQQTYETWFKKAEQPETNATRDLLSIMRVLTLLGYTDSSQVTDKLSPVAQACIKQFDMAKMQDAVGKLVDRQYNGKALPLVAKYKGDLSRAPAGIPFALTAARQYALWNGGEAQADDMLQQVGQWYTKAFDSVEKNVFQEHQYYWCPSYFTMLHEVYLLGTAEDKGSVTTLDTGQTWHGQPMKTLIDNSHFLKVMQRMVDFMHFKVKMDGWLTSNQDKQHSRVHWTGETELSFDIDYKKNCYTPKFSGNVMHVKVNDWMMTSDTGGHLNLVGPHEFDTPIAGVNFNLCGQDPTMRIVFANWGPPSQTDAPMAPPIPLFSGTMQALIANDKKQGGQLQTESAQGKSTLESLKAELQKHQGDTAWMMSPAGQALIAKIQAAAMGGGNGMASDNGGLAMIHITQEVVLPWKNGTTSVVDKTFQLDRDTAHMSAHFTIENDPQNGSESGPN